VTSGSLLRAFPAVRCGGFGETRFSALAVARVDPRESGNAKKRLAAHLSAAGGKRWCEAGGVPLESFGRLRQLSPYSLTSPRVPPSVRPLS